MSSLFRQTDNSCFSSIMYYCWGVSSHFSCPELIWQNLEVSESSFLRKSTKRKSLIRRIDFIYSGQGGLKGVIVVTLVSHYQIHGKALILPDFLLVNIIQELIARRIAAVQRNFIKSRNSVDIGFYIYLQHSRWKTIQFISIPVNKALIFMLLTFWNVH